VVKKQPALLPVGRQLGLPTSGDHCRPHGHTIRHGSNLSINRLAPPQLIAWSRQRMANYKLQGKCRGWCACSMRCRWRHQQGAEGDVEGRGL